VVVPVLSCSCWSGTERSRMMALATERRSARSLPPPAAIVRFDATSGADLLVWNSRSLDIVSSGSAARHQQGRQDMR